MQPVIVIPAHTRAKSFKRLLDSIIRSDLSADSAKIVISLDGGYSSSVLIIAENFIKNNQQLDIALIKKNKNIGLKEHIIWCGDLSIEYGSVIVLEDDLIVAKDFYKYASNSLAFYETDENIAGIALYSQKYNEYVNLPFEAIPNGSDNYFVQMACSWGQAWSKSQWVKFKEWFSTVDADYLKTINALPTQVSNWPDTSWKKFYSAYLVSKNLYFSYPYVSRTSNCSDAGGEHIKNQLDIFQVPISNNYFYRKNYIFCDFNIDTIKYDSFMEAVFPEDLKIEGICAKDIAIDLYGSKPKDLILQYKYAITIKTCFEPIVKFPVRYKPLENNILLGFEGDIDSGLCFNLCESRFIDFNDDLSRFLRFAGFASFLSYFRTRR